MDEPELIDLSLLEAPQSMTAQTRAAVRPATVAEYAERMSAGERFDAVLAYRDTDGTIRLAAGFHRVAAARAAGKTVIAAIVHPGDQWAAVQAGLRDNRQHRGERLSSADKRFAAALVLRMHPEFSDAVVASLIGCSDRTVSKYRDESGPKISGVETRVGLDGKSYSVAQHASAATSSTPVGEIKNELPAAQSQKTGQPSPGVSETPPPACSARAQQERPVPAAVSDQPAALIQTPCPAPERTAAPAGPDTTSSKPLADLIYEAQRRLGALARAADELRSSDGARYRRLRGHLDTIGVELDHWPQEEQPIF
jgi:hypothetical protein